MNHTTPRSVVAALALLPLLAACGTTEPPASSGDTGDSRTEAAPRETGSAGEITVTDAAGEQITLDAPAQRVVSLEWGQTEDLLTLGVSPVAVADAEGFRTWVSSVELPEDTADVGLRTEPSLESIAAADPDLIIGVQGSIPENALAQAQQIAPVLLLPGGNAADPLGTMEENFRTVATVVGEEEQGEEVLTQFRDHLSANAEELGEVAHPYVFTFINTTGNTVDLRMHSDRSLPGAVALEMGLENAYTEPGDDVWGIGSMDLEAMTTLPPDTYVLSWHNSTTDATDALAGNALWQGLPFVQAGNVIPVAQEIWVYGGPSSLMQWSDELVETLGR